MQHQQLFRCLTSLPFACRTLRAVGRSAFAVCVCERSPRLTQFRLPYEIKQLITKDFTAEKWNLTRHAQTDAHSRSGSALRGQNESFERTFGSGFFPNGFAFIGSSDLTFYSA